MNARHATDWLRFQARIAVLLAAMLMATPVAAQALQPTDKASDGAFTGFLLLTDDLAWVEMFQRPEPPEFSVKDQFLAGETGSVAILFSNAQPSGGAVHVQCAISAREADGTVREFPPRDCFEGPVRPANVFYPSLLDVRFSVGDDDPVGRAGFDVELRDQNSGRSVELSVTYQQGEPE